MKPHQFERILQSLSGWRAMAFCLALAERAWPNYALFCRVSGFPGETRLRGILDESWRYLEQGEAHDPYRWLVRMEECLPDPADFDVYGVHPAVDFWTLLEHAWLSQTESDKPRAALASAISLATVQGFVEMTDGQGLDDDALVKVLDESPYMQGELDFQFWLADTLRKQPAPDAQFLADLYADAANDGISNIGISLEEGDEAGAA